MKFAAIDFETADNQRDSACAVGMVVVHDGAIVQRVRMLIRPPRRDFVHTGIHGITWRQVARAPTFREVWGALRPNVRGIDFLAAHGAQFDRSVLNACCSAHGLPPPRLPFVCTIRIARDVWNLHPTTLPDVCARLKIELDHHDALSDADACARILLAAARKTSARHVAAVGSM